MMQQVALRRAMLAARSVPREEPKIAMPVMRIPKPPTRDRLMMVLGEQHDAHVIDYIRVTFSAWAPARFEAIRRAVCIRFGITKLEIMSRRREQRIARARQVCMYLAKTHTPCSFPEIGRRAGNFDHTTVIHAVKRIANLRTTNAELDAAITAVESKLEVTNVHD